MLAAKQSAGRSEDCCPIREKKSPSYSIQAQGNNQQTSAERYGHCVRCIVIVFKQLISPWLSRNSHSLKSFVHSDNQWVVVRLLEGSV